MGNREIENNARMNALAELEEYLNKRYGEVYKIPTTKQLVKNNYAFAVPIVDKDGNELYLKFEITTPRPARGEKEYDPYALAERLKEETADGGEDD